MMKKFKIKKLYYILFILTAILAFSYYNFIGTIDKALSNEENLEEILYSLTNEEKVDNEVLKGNLETPLTSLGLVYLIEGEELDTEFIVKVVDEELGRSKEETRNLLLKRRKNFFWARLSIIVILVIIFILYYLMNRKIEEEYSDGYRKIRKALSDCLPVDMQESEGLDIDRLVKEISSCKTQVDLNILTMVKKADGLEELAKNLKDKNIELAVKSEFQYRYLEDVNRSVGEIRKAISRNSNKAIQLTKLTKNTRQSTEFIIKESNELNDIVLALKQSAKEIESITGTISSLAFQTTILSLNSAVESVRDTAGSHNAFDIISNEIHKLSTDSKKAASKVKELSNVNSLKVDLITTSIEKTQILLASIINKINRIVMIIDEISDTAKEETNEAREISQSMESIEKMVKETADIARSASRLSQRFVEEGSAFSAYIEGSLEKKVEDTADEPEDDYEGLEVSLDEL